MANSAACPNISAITQRLKRQTLLTPTAAIAGPERREDSPPVPAPRRSLTGDTPKSKPRTKFFKPKDCGPPAADRTVTDENVGPSPTPRVSLSRRHPISSIAKSAALPPRPTQSAGLPRISARNFHALPTTPNSATGAGLAELPSGGAAVRRELSASACAPPSASASPPPVKRFCRSLTEGLPRPKPLRPAATNTAEPERRLAPSDDHMRSLIAASRLRNARPSSPLPSSFVPYPRGGVRPCGLSSSASSFHSGLSSSGYGSGSTASLLDTTLGAVEPELEEIEAAIDAPHVSRGRSERPHAPSPERQSAAFNPALTKEKFEAEKVYRRIGDKFVHDRSKTREDFFPNGSRSILYDLPEFQERPPAKAAAAWPNRKKSPIAPAVWVPCGPIARDDSEGEEREEEEEEEEEELTLMEESRRSSRGDFEDLDLDSMEKDDSWCL